MNPSSSAAAQAGEPALPTPGAAPEQPAIPGLTPPTRRGGVKRRIGEVIVDLGFAQEDRVEAAVSAAKDAGKTTGQMLIDSGVLDSDQLARALAERNGLDHVDLNVFEVDRSAATLIESTAAKRHHTVPIAFVGEKTLLVATADPSNVLALDDITMMTGYEIRRAVASPEDIDALLSTLSTLGDTVKEIQEEEEPEELSQVMDAPRAADDAPVVKLVHSVIGDAVERGASGLHFDPRNGDMRVRCRIDGLVQDTTRGRKRMPAGVI